MHNNLKKMWPDQQAKPMTITTVGQHDRKILEVPYRITSGQIQEALGDVQNNFKLRHCKVRYYSIDSAFEIIEDIFTSLPAHYLFEYAGFFEHIDLPTGFMLENGFAGSLSDIMGLSSSEKRKKKYCVTAKGLFFLIAVLHKLRNEIDYTIFY